MAIKDAIIYENNGFFILRTAKAFEVYKPTSTAAVKCGTVGLTFPNAWGRAVSECDRRAVEISRARNVAQELG